MDAKREVLVDPSAPTVTRRRAVRLALPATHVVMVAFAVLSTIGVISLFVFSDRTEDWFAWTVVPPLTACFFGACFGSTLVIEVFSARQRAWAPIRVDALVVFVFAALTLAATLMHLDKFHLTADRAATFQAQAAAWLWLIVYITAPIALPVLMLVQERAPGVDPPDRHPLPVALRTALGLESAVMLVVGVMLFALPSKSPGLWPWPLTPLTSQATGAWVIAFGLAAGISALSGDLGRQRGSTIAYTVLGVLVLVATLRFSGTVQWNEPSAWVYLGMVVAVALTGAAGWWLAPPPREYLDG
jgi:hypothetical protein